MGDNCAMLSALTTEPGGHLMLQGNHVGACVPSWGVSPWPVRRSQWWSRCIRAGRRIRSIGVPRL